MALISGLLVFLESTCAKYETVSQTIFTKIADLALHERGRVGYNSSYLIGSVNAQYQELLLFIGAVGARKLFSDSRLYLSGSSCWPRPHHPR